MKFGVISDTHKHAWQAFAETNPAGVNTRLQIILDETWRAAEAIKDFGGSLLVHTGDMFHVHGHIAPSVLNPTVDLYKKIRQSLGLEVIILAGNHDLEARDSSRVSNAITALEGIGCTAIHQPMLVGDFFFVPWIRDIASLKTELERAHTSDTYLFMHAPIDGVIKGLPDKGLTDAYLDGLNYKAVFCGHYHHHKVMGPKFNIISVGALTHQTWGDVGTKAGFLLVDGSDITYQASRAPSFVEIDGSMSEEEILCEVDGNYVRARVNTSNPSEVEATRAHLLSLGAKGVVIIANPPKSVAPARTSVSYSGASLSSSVKEWIDDSLIVNKPRVLAEALAVLETVQSR